MPPAAVVEVGDPGGDLQPGFGSGAVDPGLPRSPQWMLTTVAAILANPPLHPATGMESTTHGPREPGTHPGLDRQDDRQRWNSPARWAICERSAH